MNKILNCFVKSGSWKKIICYFFLAGFILSVLAMVIVLHIISDDVRAMCDKAQSEFQGGCVKALVAYVESDNHTFAEKHDAIWALGEIGDPRCIPTLQKLWTGEPCTKPCRYDLYICQYQLEKSVQRCQGFNVMRYVWRWI